MLKNKEYNVDWSHDPVCMSKIIAQTFIYITQLHELQQEDTGNHDYIHCQ